MQSNSTKFARRYDREFKVPLPKDRIDQMVRQLPDG